MTNLPTGPLSGDTSFRGDELVVLFHEDGGVLTMLPEDARVAICLFSSVLEAEECLVAWGHDVDEFTPVSCTTAKELLLLLWTAQATVEYIIIDPPLRRGTRAVAYTMESALQTLRDAVFDGPE